MRFLLVERHSTPPKHQGLRKTTPIFRNVNPIKLLRPIEGRPWEYQFYADIGEMCETVKALGSYGSVTSAG